MSSLSFPPVSEAVSLLNVNVRSLRSNFESFKVSIEQLENTPSDIAVTETWLSPDDSAEL